jgi:hypothetical protein
MRPCALSLENESVKREREVNEDDLHPAAVVCPPCWEQVGRHREDRVRRHGRSNTTAADGRHDLRRYRRTGQDRHTVRASAHLARVSRAGHVAVVHAGECGRTSDVGGGAEALVAVLDGREWVATRGAKRGADAGRVRTGELVVLRRSKDAGGWIYRAGVERRPAGGEGAVRCGRGGGGQRTGGGDR